jgi:hypothetical protein
MHKAFSVLNTLCDIEWDRGNDFFDPTCLQFSNIQSGTGATNVIPGELTAVFNLRFSTETTAEAIKSQCEAVLDASGVDYEIDWQLSGHPFLTEPGDLVDAARESIAETTGIATSLSTGGGTSDGRFIATMGSQIIELGPINASIHQRERTCVDRRYSQACPNLRGHYGTSADLAPSDLIYLKKIEVCAGNGCPETLDKHAKIRFACLTPDIRLRWPQEDPH